VLSLSWMKDAACRDADPELFFPEGRTYSRSVNRALLICHECPVVLQCRMYQEEIGARYGIWGGRWMRENIGHCRDDMADLQKRWTVRAKRGGWSAKQLAEKVGVSTKTARKWLSA